MVLSTRKTIQMVCMLGVLLLASPALHAQDFLQKAKNYLDAGECEKAQKAYNAYKVENPGGNAEVERRIAECWKKVDSLQALLDGQPCHETPTVTDYDGNIYNTVQIGKQCWMKENLRTERYADGIKISWCDWDTNTTKGYRSYPYKNFSLLKQYGYLYNWKAVMRNSSSSNANPSGVQGICPEGWHVPSDAEWSQLADYVGSQSRYLCGNKKKSIGKALASSSEWLDDSNLLFKDGQTLLQYGGDRMACDVCENQETNNATGFTALPAGEKDEYAYSFGGSAFFWSATEVDGKRAISYYLLYDADEFMRYGYGHKKSDSYSVRCVRD